LTCAFTFSFARGEKPYFQQDVNYLIAADIDPESHMIAGIETISYRNNSPDTLNEIYFHLYYNAFQPGSYLDIQDRRAGDFRIANTPKKRQGDVAIDKLTIDGIETTDFLIDNTIMRVPLISALPPGDSAVFYIEFTSQIPARGSRAGYRGKHFDIGQWYPKPVVYDRFGWHVHQYLDYEFYADYGSFDVEITMPSEYIIAHVGELLNEEEIFGQKLPDPVGDTILVDVLSMIADSSDTEKKPASESGANGPGVEDEHGFSYIHAEDDAEKDSDKNKNSADEESRKTWRIHAENIHDFAFCADPKFIVDFCRYDNVLIKSYYYKPFDKHWARQAAEYTRKSIKYFSETCFPYPYGQYSTVAALAGGGMEYPQLTMINGRSGSRTDYTHGLESIIAHEVGHAWFYGILGFNETEQSYLDEGLTTYITNLYLEHYYGRYKNDYSYKTNWQKRLLPNGNERNNNLRSYVRRAITGNEDPMITPANLFADGGRYYSASYEKASSVYFMLRYTFGAEKYARFIKLLFQRWAFKHPYLSDFQELAEEVYGGDLDWFFRQWFTTTWSLDYALTKMKSSNATVDGISGYNVSLTIEKPGRCISPLDIALYSKKGIVDTAYIPLESWTDGQTKFDTTIFLTNRPRKAIIDPGDNLADTDRLNNRTGLIPLHRQFLVPQFIDSHSYIEHFVDSYTIAHQPLLWYNSVDGAKPGYRIFGSYLGENRKLDLDMSVGAMNGKPSYFAGYEDVLYSINPYLSYFVNTREEEGRGRQAAGIYYTRRVGWGTEVTRVSISLNRHYLFNDRYLRTNDWSEGDINIVRLSVRKSSRRMYSTIELNADLNSSVPGSRYDFTRANGEIKLTIPNFGGGDTRIELKTGVANGGVPLQRRFYLSSADPYEVWDSPLYRSKGTLPDEWIRENHLFMEGGAGLAGYLERGLTGTRMISARISRDLPKLRLPVKLPIISDQLARIEPDLYLASGLVWERGNNPKFDDYLSEAGFNLRYRIPVLERFIDECRLTLHLPIWLSDPIDGDKELKWRWLFSIGK